MLAVVVAGLGGCVSAHKLDQALAIPVGMNEVQVINKIGQPVLKDRSEGGVERWIWSREGQFGPESVTLTMKNGRVAAVQSEGERLEHLKQIRALDAVIAGAAPATNLSVSRIGSAVKEEPRAATLPAAPQDKAATPPVVPAAAGEDSAGVAPELQAEKGPAPAESDEALAELRRKALEIQEKLRAPQKPVASVEAEKTPPPAPPLETPPLTAWYMARQFVSEHLAPARSIFPNPRFVSDAAGEVRTEGNIWRTWGYVDTMTNNAPKRLQWTAELEFQGGSRWKLQGPIAFGEK